MKYRRSKNSKPIPILLDEALRDRIEALSEKMGEPKSTIMRFAMRIGLEGLEKTLESNPELSSLIHHSQEESTTAPHVLNDAVPSSSADLEDQIVKNLEEDLGGGAGGKKKRHARQKSGQSPAE